MNDTLLMIETADMDVTISSFAGHHPTQVETYQGVDVPGFLALGPDEPSLTASSVCRRVDVRLARGRFGAADSSYLFRVGIWTPVAFREELIEWYDVDHFPILLECGEWHGGRLVEEKVADGCQFYAMHSLGSPAALDSDARKRSRATEWFRRLARNDWFDKKFVRALYRRAALNP